VRRFSTDFGQAEPLVFAVIGQVYSVEVNNRGRFPHRPRRQAHDAADDAAVNTIRDRDYRTSRIQLQPGVNRIAVRCAGPEQRVNMDVTLSCKQKISSGSRGRQRASSTAASYGAATI